MLQGFELLSKTCNLVQGNIVIYFSRQARRGLFFRECSWCETFYRMMVNLNSNRGNINLSLPSSQEALIGCIHGENVYCGLLFTFQSLALTSSTKGSQAWQRLFSAWTCMSLQEIISGYFARLPSDMWLLWFYFYNNLIMENCLPVIRISVALCRHAMYKLLVHCSSPLQTVS